MRLDPVSAMHFLSLIKVCISNCMMYFNPSMTIGPFEASVQHGAPLNVISTKREFSALSILLNTVFQNKGGLSKLS